MQVRPAALPVSRLDGKGDRGRAGEEGGFYGGARLPLGRGCGPLCKGAGGRNDGGGRQEGIEESEMNLFGSANASGEAVEQDFGLFARESGAAKLG
jgi:hypothetical protein